MMGCKRGGCSTVDHEFAKCHRNRKYHRNEAEKVVGEGLDLPPLAKHEPMNPRGPAPKALKQTEAIHHH